MLKWLWSRMRTVNVPLAAAAVFASGILHILATFATPFLTPGSAYGSLAGDLQPNRMQLLADISPDAQPLPYLSSDALYAICRFDSTDGVVNLTARLPDPGWVLALFSPAGDNFFTSVAGPGRRPEVSIRIVPKDSVWSAPSTSESFDATALTVRANEGLALIRAPDRGEAYRVRALAALKRAGCQYQRTAPL